MWNRINSFLNYKEKLCNWERSNINISLTIISIHLYADLCRYELYSTDFLWCLKTHDNSFISSKTLSAYQWQKIKEALVE